MSSQRLEEFCFNLETYDLLIQSGRSVEQAVETMRPLVGALVSFMTNNRTLLNSVLLRLQLCNERNLPESTVRISLSVFKSDDMTNLLNYLYPSTKHTNVQPDTQQVQIIARSTPSAAPPVAPPVAPSATQSVVQPVAQVMPTYLDEEDDENYFDSFYGECVKETNDASDVVKLSQLYSAFYKWWNTHYENEVPTKEELKDFLTEKLGHPVKSTLTNMSLTV